MYMKIKTAAYHLHTRDTLVLKQWMRWCPYILVPKLTDEEWLIVKK